MKATEARLLSFLQKSPQFIIPIYQRTYSWTDKQCRQLWDDIVRRGSSDTIAVHFIGSIVYVEQGLSQVTDTDRVAKRIREDIAPKAAADTAYQNAKENTPHTARMAHDQALGKVMQHLLKDDTQVYKQFVENESFKRFVGDMVYAITNQE